MQQRGSQPHTSIRLFLICFRVSPVFYPSNLSISLSALCWHPVSLGLRHPFIPPISHFQFIPFAVAPFFVLRAPSFILFSLLFSPSLCASLSLEASLLKLGLQGFLSLSVSVCLSLLKFKQWKFRQKWDWVVIVPHASASACTFFGCVCEDEKRRVCMPVCVLQKHILSQGCVWLGVQ